MRTLIAAVAICAGLAGIARSAPPTTSNEPAGAGKVTPLILEANEGEKRAWRPIEGAVAENAAHPVPFIFKVDRKNGGSSKLVFLTEDIPVGGKIDRHRHPGADEIIFLQNGHARIRLGEKVREVHAGATIFMPADTWIELTNIGSEAIHGVFVFSAPGFDDFMRAESVPDGQKLTPLTKSEDEQIVKQHAHSVIYAEP